MKSLQVSPFFRLTHLSVLGSEDKLVSDTVFITGLE